MRYEVFVGTDLIGVTALEKGDPPMGVASGRMFPTDQYQPAKHAGSTVSGLRIRPEGAEFFELQGAYIEDYSPELGEDGLEVTILGLGHLEYAEHFPQHLKAYEERFKA